MVPNLARFQKMIKLPKLKNLFILCYSEEKAKLLRSIGDDIEAANTDLAVFMSSMGLDGPNVVPSPGDHVQVRWFG